MEEQQPEGSAISAQEVAAISVQSDPAVETPKAEVKPPPHAPYGTAERLTYMPRIKKSRRGVVYVYTQVIPGFTHSVRPAVNFERRFYHAAAAVLGYNSPRQRHRHRHEIEAFLNEQLARARAAVEAM